VDDVVVVRSVEHVPDGLELPRVLQQDGDTGRATVVMMMMMVMVMVVMMIMTMITMVAIMMMTAPLALWTIKPKHILALSRLASDPFTRLWYWASMAGNARR
jgi:hypothetical protein